MKKIIFQTVFFLLWCNTTLANCVGNCTDGFGTFTYQNGDKYVGEFKNGQANGQGKFILQNGDTYVGEVKDDNINGQGTYTWANGNKYIGNHQ